MITLGTGLPGNGKTLFMLDFIAAKAEKESREVYYHGINLADVAPVNRWMKFEPEKWMDLPKGCIIVMDECQTVFPKKPNGAQMPKHYEDLTTHRHHGFDMFFITQHPTLIDNYVRKLVGQHFHSIRKFGMERATIYEWSAAAPAPENASSHKNAISRTFKFPKKVYTWYKSAEVHTVKRTIPAKLVLAVLFIVAVLAYTYFITNRYAHRGDKPAPAAGEVATGSAPGVQPGQARPAAAPAGGSPSVDPVQDAKDYVWKQTPRVVGLQFTAPKYDALTVPTHVPIPAMCMSKESHDGKTVTCKCYSQQATPLDVPYNMCIEFSRHGFFRDFDADRDQQQVARSEASQKALQRVPDAPLPEHGYGGSGASGVLPGEPMGPARTERSAPLNAIIQDGPPNNRATRAAAGNTIAGL